MSSLDKRLRSLLVTVDGEKPVAVFLNKDAINNDDMEYLSAQAMDWPEKSVFILIKGDPENDIITAPLMTGQEWYNRFDAALTDWFKEKYNYGFLKENILGVAHRAAGIEEKR